MTTLRTRVIRLAASRPELREHLLPLVQASEEIRKLPRWVTPQGFGGGSALSDALATLEAAERDGESPVINSSTSVIQPSSYLRGPLGTKPKPPWWTLSVGTNYAKGEIDVSVRLVAPIGFLRGSMHLSPRSEVMRVAEVTDREFSPIVAAARHAGITVVEAVPLVAYSRWNHVIRSFKTTVDLDGAEKLIVILPSAGIDVSRLTKAVEDLRAQMAKKEAEARRHEIERAEHEARFRRWLDESGIVSWEYVKERPVLDWRVSRGEVYIAEAPGQTAGQVEKAVLSYFRVHYLTVDSLSGGKFQVHMGWDTSD